MAVGDLIKLVVNQSLQSSVVQNVLYYKVVTDPTVFTVIDDINQDFNAKIIVASWKGLISNELNFDCNTLQKVFPLPEGASQDEVTNIAGGIVKESLPAMSSVLLQKINNTTSGVGKKGRIYIAGLPEDDTADGRLALTVRPAWLTLAGLFGNELVTVNGGVYKPAWAIRSPTTPFAITGSVEIDEVKILPRIATQRRRRTPIRAFSS